MNHARTQTISPVSTAKLFYVLAALTAASFILYLFFIGQTVFRLVKEKDLENRNRALSAEIAELELSTLALNDSISIEKAYELGFVQPHTTEYVRASELSLR